MGKRSLISQAALERRTGEAHVELAKAYFADDRGTYQKAMREVAWTRQELGHRAVNPELAESVATSDDELLAPDDIDDIAPGSFDYLAPMPRVDAGTERFRYFSGRRKATWIGMEVLEVAALRSNPSTGFDLDVDSILPLTAIRAADGKLIGGRGARLVNWPITSEEIPADSYLQLKEYREWLRISWCIEAMRDPSGGDFPPHDLDGNEGYVRNAYKSLGLGVVKRGEAATMVQAEISVGLSLWLIKRHRLPEDLETGRRTAIEPQGLAVRMTGARAMADIFPECRDVIEGLVLPQLHSSLERALDFRSAGIGL